VDSLHTHIAAAAVGGRLHNTVTSHNLQQLHTGKMERRLRQALGLLLLVGLWCLM